MKLIEISTFQRCSEIMDLSLALSIKVSNADVSKNKAL